MCYPHRYTTDADGDMMRMDGGEWVKASDYDALRAKLAEAEQTIAVRQQAFDAVFDKVESLETDCQYWRKDYTELQQALTAATERVKALEEALKYYGGEDGVCINDGGKRAKAALAHKRV